MKKQILILFSIISVLVVFIVFEMLYVANVNKKLHIIESKLYKLSQIIESHYVSKDSDLLNQIKTFPIDTISINMKDTSNWSVLDVESTSFDIPIKSCQWDLNNDGIYESINDIGILSVSISKLNKLEAKAINGIFIIPAKVIDINNKVYKGFQYIKQDTINDFVRMMYVSHSDSVTKKISPYYGKVFFDLNTFTQPKYNPIVGILMNTTDCMKNRDIMSFFSHDKRNLILEPCMYDNNRFFKIYFKHLNFVKKGGKFYSGYRIMLRNIE